MLVLGLILILLAGGALVAVLASGTGDQAALYGGDVNLPTLVVFLAGAAALLLFIMGLELVRSGLRRANQNRRNNRRLRRLEKQERQGREEPSQAGASTEPADSAGGREPRPEPGPISSASRNAEGPYEAPPPAR